jgi:membrane-bound lytic murein transglycosylase B
LPPEVIVGILGVETIYGRFMGNFRVLDALTTLAFDYPNTPNRADREQTFRKNLEDYLVWTRDSQIDPTSVLGSYTGAIGIPQFLPSSIVQYAISYDGNKQIDLRNSQADAIGSVANYLKQNGWENGRPVVWNIGADAGSQGIAQAGADGQPEPHWPLEQLLRAGMIVDQPGLDMNAEAGTPVTIIDLPTPGMPTEYKLGLKNFYVLTRYNRSFFYALSVYQLGERIKAQLEASGDLDSNGAPGSVPPGMVPPGAQPPASTLPGSVPLRNLMPQGAVPQGSMPQGSMPQGSMPPPSAPAQMAVPPSASPIPQPLGMPAPAIAPTPDSSDSQ